MAQKKQKRKYTTLRIYEDTKQRLGTFGTTNETYDQLINRLLDTILKSKLVVFGTLTAGYEKKMKQT